MKTRLSSEDSQELTSLDFWANLTPEGSLRLIFERSWKETVNNKKSGLKASAYGREGGAGCSSLLWTFVEWFVIWLLYRNVVWILKIWTDLTPNLLIFCAPLECCWKIKILYQNYCLAQHFKASCDDWRTLRQYQRKRRRSSAIDYWGAEGPFWVSAEVLWQSKPNLLSSSWTGVNIPQMRSWKFTSLSQLKARKILMASILQRREEFRLNNFV
jgi:hypothetical protein